MLKKILNKVKTDGLDGIWFRILRLFNKSLVYNNLFEKKKYNLSIDLYNKYKNTVICGPYQGIYFSKNNHWGIGDLGAKIIGTYELEVQEKLLSIISQFKLENFIDIGAAEGYHAVGIGKKSNIKQIILYEVDPKGREILRENIKKNNLKQEILIEKQANIDTFKYLNSKIDLARSIFLIDIEGYEVELFEENIYKLLKNSYLIIENHQFLLNDEKQKRYLLFLNRLRDNFNFQIIKNTGRNLSEINEIINVSENDLMMLISESRPIIMEWILLTPKR